MKVNEMVFFDRLRIIHKRLDDAYMHVIMPIAPMKTIEHHKQRINRFWESITAVKEAKEDLEMLLSLVMEDPQHIALQGQHNLKKDDLYQLLGINKPMPRPPIGITKAYPVKSVKAVPVEQEEEDESTV